MDHNLPTPRLDARGDTGPFCFDIYGKDFNSSSSPLILQLFSIRGIIYS